MLVRGAVYAPSLLTPAFNARLQPWQASQGRRRLKWTDTRQSCVCSTCRAAAARVRSCGTRARVCVRAGFTCAGMHACKQRWMRACTRHASCAHCDARGHCPACAAASQGGVPPHNAMLLQCVRHAAALRCCGDTSSGTAAFACGPFLMRRMRGQALTARTRTAWTSCALRCPPLCSARSTSASARVESVCRGSLTWPDPRTPVLLRPSRSSAPSVLRCLIRLSRGLWRCAPHTNSWCALRQLWPASDD